MRPKCSTRPADTRLHLLLLSAQAPDDCKVLLAYFGDDDRDRACGALTRSRAQAMRSKVRDIERGSITEGEHILGDMVTRARVLDIDTPILNLARKACRGIRDRPHAGRPHRRARRAFATAGALDLPELQLTTAQNLRDRIFEGSTLGRTRCECAPALGSRRYAPA